MIDSGRVDDAVGPVLQATPLGWAVVAAIEADNDGVEVRDEGAYLRVLVPRVCSVTRAEVEAQFGQPVQFPGDLEVILSSFCGRRVIIRSSIFSQWVNRCGEAM